MTLVTRSLATLAALALGIAPIAGCGGDDVKRDPAAQRTPTPAGQSGQPALSDLLADGDAYVGEEVEVTADVSRVLAGPGAFTLGDEEQAAGEEEAEDDVKTDADELPVAVAAGTEVPDGIAENAVVRIRGTVRELEPGFLDEFDLLLEQEGTPESDALNEFQGGIVIVADDVELVDPAAESQGEEARGEEQGQQPELEPLATPTPTPGEGTGGAAPEEDTGGAEAPADEPEATPTATP